MRRSRGLGTSCAALFFLSAFAIILTSNVRTVSAQTPADFRAPDNSDADAARWKNGELLPPLPVDPVRRAEAIRRAKELGRARRAESGFAPAAGVRVLRRDFQPRPVGAPSPSGTSRRQPDRLAPRFPVMPEAPFEPVVPAAGQLREADRRPDFIDNSPSAFDMLIGSFEAVDYTLWTPPSPDVAAGPNHVLVATTDVFAVYDKCGNWIDGGDFAEYFGVPPAYTCYDPRVVYDDWDSRWIMAYIATDQVSDESRICIAISENGDLADGWSCMLTCNLANLDCFADNMHVAVDPEAIYVTFNNFNFVTYAVETPAIWALDKMEAYQSSTVFGVGFSNLNNPGDGSLAFAVRPAQMHSYGGEMYFLNNKYQGGSIFTLWVLEDPFGTYDLSSYSKSTSAYTAPPLMRQPNGTYVRGGDCRVADLVYDDGLLFTAFCDAWSAISKVNIWRFDVVTLAYTSWSAAVSDNFLAYPSIELDEYGQLAILYTCCSYANPAYLSLRGLIWDWRNNTVIDSRALTSGLADFTLGGSGTLTNPYRWGNQTGCAIDPVDDRTFWTCGPYASNDPAPSWATRVNAVSGFYGSSLDFEPDSLVTGGVVGGPFADEILTVTLSNEGFTGLNWEINSNPFWVTPSPMSGQIPPQGTQQVSFLIDEGAESLPAGTYFETIGFNNCTGGVAGECAVQLHVVDPIVCPAAILSLAPRTAVASALYGTDEYSVYIAAMEDIDVCAIGLALMHAEPKTIACSVYETHGAIRGALVGSNSAVAVQEADEIYMVPMDISLQACQNYEIVFTHSGSIAHASYPKSSISYPFDAGGVIRVWQAATNGSSGTQHPGIVVFGHAERSEVTGRTTDLRPLGGEHTESTTDRSVGLFITAHENLYLSSAELEADLVRDRWLVANVREAAGNTRGPVVAKGVLPVGTGGLAHHEVPIHALLEAGRDYNISFDIEGRGYWPAVAETEATLPYTVDDAIEVRKGELAGSAAPNLPSIRLNWEEVSARGAAFDLAKSADGIPPPYSKLGPLDHGAIVRPSATQQVYSLGVRADIPEGAKIYARIYLAPGGVRGPLLTEGSAQSGGGGMRWHDVPVAAAWEGLGLCDLSIVCENAAEFGFWLDTTGMPYSPYGGVIQVQDAEAAGSTSGKELIHLRVNACNEAMTGIGDYPLPFTPFMLDAPAPNPANGLVRVRYSADAPGAVDLEIYDVAGRRVASVFAGRHLDAGPGTVDFDASALASGVYFLKLTAGGKSVSRKMVITR